MKKFLPAIFLTLTILGCSCDSTEPPIAVDKPGRRDYTWSVDTLKAAQGNLFYLWSLWGSSPQDLWAVGNGDAQYTIWHFNKDKWEPYKAISTGSLNSIYGSTGSNIWACGLGAIYHFNGNNWYLQSDFTENNSEITYINNIWGKENTNVYVAGSTYNLETSLTRGIIMKYNGRDWVDLNVQDNQNSFVWIRQDLNENTFLTAIKFDQNGDTNKIIQYNGESIKELWSGQKVATVNEMNGRIYFAIGKNIYKYNKDKLEIWKDFTGTSYLGRVWGRSENDFFGVASDGLAHYNGTDLTTLYPTDLFINDLFVMDNDIFMLCENRIIIHGKLN